MGEFFSDWQVWAILGLLLLIFEIFVPGFVLGCLSIGAFFTAIFSFFGISLEIELLIFAASSVAAFFTIRPLVMKRGFTNEAMRTNVDSLAGRVAKVSQTFDTQFNKGRVAVDGDDWLAFTENSIPLEAGDKVEIVRVESNSLIVRPST